MTDPRKSKIESIKQEVGEFHPLLDILLRRLPDVIDVEYTHGPTEMGADFVFSRMHTLLGHQEYIGVIAKVGKITQDFSDVDRQIEECSLLRTFNGGKQKIRIDEIWVVSNDVISKNAQEKIFEKYKTSKIQFITGERLIKIIDQYYPAYWSNTTLQVGEYLSVLKVKNEEIDKQFSLIQVPNHCFYIEQDLYEYPRYEYRKMMQVKNKKPKKINIIEQIKKHNFILIEGGAGSGKSKLLRYLIDHFTTTDVFLETKTLPIFITYKELKDNFELSIKKLLENKINKKIQDELGSEHISFLILIDAFDETNTKIEEQIDELSKLEDELRSIFNTKVVITSRYLSELDRTNVLENEINRFHLSPLSMNRTLEFVKTLCQNLNLASRLIEDLKKSQLLKEMPRSPIAAILLAKLINEHPKDLPSSMSELYAQYVELTLGRWEIEKGLETQKEYQALDNILVEYAKYVLNYETPKIPIKDAKYIVEQYLSERNLEINPTELFEKIIRRCDIVTVDSKSCYVSFKHRSFAEFFYAKYLMKPRSDFDIEKEAFTLYWMNTVFFYLGLLKDAPELLKTLSNVEPPSEGERWLKFINMANYMLAAFATPYSVVSEATTKALLEAGTLFNDIASRKIDSPFAKLPHMHLLNLMQFLVRNSYGFEFFKQALEDAVIRISDSNQPSALKVYSLFFANVTYIDLCPDESFDMILKQYIGELPLDVNLAIHHESEDLKERSDLMRKQDRKIKHLLKDNSPLKHELKLLYEKPINLLTSPTSENGESN